MDKEYTFYSPSHKSFSQIDYFLATQPTLLAFQRSDSEAIAISDHTPATVCLKTTKNNTGRMAWRFPSYLQENLELNHYLKNAWMEYADTNKQQTSDPILFWKLERPLLGAGSCLSLQQIRKISRTFDQASSQLLRNTQIIYQSNANNQPRQA